MTDEEIQMKAQRSLQEYDDAVENVDPKFAELGQKAIAALDEFISHWNKHHESPESRAGTGGKPNPASEQPDDDMRKFVERQLEWAQHEKEKVLAQLPKGSVG
jgi:hypothetical protein